MTAKDTMAATIRKAIVASGRTGTELAKTAGISQGAVSMFLTGKRGLTLDSAGKLVHALGMELRPTKRPKGRKER